MAKRHRELLARLDPVGLKRYQITEKELRTIETYLQILQGHFQVETTWEEMVRYAGPYGTSIAIHEVVEIRELRFRGIEPLDYKREALQEILGQQIEAHILAIYEEHLYLQEAIYRLYGFTFQVATLVKANRPDDTDLEYFLDSDIGVYLLEEERVADAEQVLSQLKEV